MNRLDKYRKIFNTLPVVFILLILVLFYVIKPKSTEDFPLAPTPAITSEFQDIPNVIFNIDESKIDFPDSLPLVTITQNPLSYQDSIEIAATFNLNGKPIDANDVQNGRTLIWSSEVGSLTILLNSAKINYFNAQEYPKQNFVSDETEFVNSAQLFLVNHKLIDEELLGQHEFSYLRPSINHEGLEMADKNSATILRIFFHYKNLDYSLIDLGLFSNGFFVDLYPNHEIYQAQSIKIQGLNLSNNSYRLKNFEEIKKSISQAKVAAIGNVYDSPASFNKDNLGIITINNIKVAYFRDSISKKTFQPIYILSGTAKSSKYPQVLEPVLYLPAVDDN